MSAPNFTVATTTAPIEVGETVVYIADGMIGKVVGTFENFKYVSVKFDGRDFAESVLRSKIQRAKREVAFQ